MPEAILSQPMWTERLPNGRRRLLRALRCHIPGVGWVTVPADSETDSPSIPWWARWMVRWSRVDVAGAIHDHLYRTGFNRRIADLAWRVVARSGAHRANLLQAWGCWFGLRVAGWIHYRRKRARS